VGVSSSGGLLQAWFSCLNLVNKLLGQFSEIQSIRNLYAKKSKARQKLDSYRFFSTFHGSESKGECSGFNR
jgi:hypothetical protein